MENKLKKSAHFRDLLIAALIGFTIATLLFTLVVIGVAAASHASDCKLEQVRNE